MRDAVKDTVPRSDPAAGAGDTGTNSLAGPIDAIGRAATAEPGGAPSTVTLPRSAPLGASDRVLLVEDNPVNQRVTVAMLENLGFCVDVVDNGVEAVIAATMVPYRAILMDCQIPVLNGYDTTAEIRGQLGTSRGSPIIAVTATATELDRKRCLAAGMDGILAKPLSIESLAEGLARWAPLPRPSVLDDESSPHDMPSGSDRPVLDAKVVRRLERLGTEAGEDLMEQLTVLFLAEADIRILALGDALARRDGPAVIDQAHTLGGASANVGASNLARFCAQLSTAGTAGDLASANTLLQSVEAELQRVRSALLSSRPS